MVCFLDLGVALVISQETSHGQILGKMYDSFIILSNRAHRAILNRTIVGSGIWCAHRERFEAILGLSCHCHGVAILILSFLFLAALIARHEDWNIRGGLEFLLRL